jgi:hypothetical protein
MEIARFEKARLQAAPQGRHLLGLANRRSSVSDGAENRRGFQRRETRAKRSLIPQGCLNAS